MLLAAADADVGPGGGRTSGCRPLQLARLMVGESVVPPRLFPQVVASWDKGFTSARILAFPSSAFDSFGPPALRLTDDL